MPELSRRDLIRGAAAVTGAAAVAPVAATASASAATTDSASAAKPGRHGDIRDIKHVVILMQENRSFDHYFGSLRGVRGFGDRSTITLPGGYSVWQQPTTAPGQAVTGTQYPWRLAAGTFAGTQPPSPEVGAQNYGGTDHSWETQHEAWNGGLMNAWYHAKGGPTTLGYLNRQDIPYHYALADAYTIGDAYHCSVLSATGPNRTYLWSASINADQEHGSYVAYSGGDELGKFLSWPSYPETLQAAGLSWKVYQGTDNYGDNGAEYFATFAQYDPEQGGTPAPGVVWYDNGVATVPEPYPAEDGNGDNLALAIRKDVQAGTLPQVSWVVTNQQYSEHPDGAPHDGAYYISQVLKALNTDPDTFNSTLVIIDFDENDGQFDHVPPPVPVPGTTDEFYQETSLAPQPLPVGLGFRVPLLLISPWTRGGWVTSEVSDHTSVIQFLEKWTTALGKPAICPNVSAWRRSVCGDLTNAFDFEHPVYGLPRLPGAGQPIGEPDDAYDPEPASNTMPVQEAGSKRARPLPYQPNANLGGIASGQASLSFGNTGAHVSRASHFSVYDNRAADGDLTAYPATTPGQFTVAAGTSVSASKPVSGAYDLTVVGPNRFLRHFTGDTTQAGATAQVTASYQGHEPVLALELANDGGSAVTFTVTSNHYARHGGRSYRVPGHGHATYRADPLATSDGWYDVTVTVSGDRSWSRRYVGHLENGKPSVTG
ncbi:MAG TPA: phospholipase C, phosphocholine-specific [Streptosporangiaceae bacterium]|nr:phospholipase C, phosphocholine-specific [Streptosporangiaceae bacterium]